MDNLTGQVMSLWDTLEDYAPSDMTSGEFIVPRGTLERDGLLALYDKEVWATLFDTKTIGYNDGQLIVSLVDDNQPNPAAPTDF